MNATKTAVVTGANSGIGLETARGLARKGFHVVLLCRDPNRAAAAKADIDASVPGASTAVVLGDLGSLADVRRAAAEIEATVDRLDVLVNNAGITVRTPATTVDGHDVMFAVNHLGPFLLTNLLLPLLQRSAPARIVNVASEAHKFGTLRLDDLAATRGYGLLGMPRYGETKLMNILTTRQLAQRLAGTEVTANCLHPGAVRTALGAPPKPIGAVLGLVMQSPANGARTSLAVATDPAFVDHSGCYFAKSRPADDKLSKRAQDDAAGAALWAASAALVDLPVA